MKIISGKFKGRKISMPKGIRPTSDRVREAVFEILKNALQGSFFLDLYSGSGAMGMEALSRGAFGAVFVDSDSKCINTLKKNLSLINIDKIHDIYVYKKKADAILGILESSGRKFDIVFLDPPYYKDMAKNTLIALSRYDILTRNAVVIAEIHKKDALPESTESLIKTKTSVYGDTKLEFFKPL